MAFDQNNPPSLIASGIGGSRGLKAWAWKHSDPIATVIGSGYIRTARKLGMGVGDAVRYVDSSNDPHHLVLTAIDADTGWGTLAFPETAPEAYPVDTTPSGIMYVLAYIDGVQSRVDPTLLPSGVLTFASQAEAEAGIAVDKPMNALRTKQAIAAQVVPNPAIASQAEAEAGTDNAKMMTALRTKQAIDAKVIARANLLPALAGSISVSVKEYNAVGNGVTDDTAAIRAAITGVGVGGAIFFPPGQYILTDNLPLLDNQRIVAGPGVTIEQTTASKEIFIATTKTGIVLDIAGTILKGKGVYGGNPGGTWTGNGNSMDRAIHLLGCTNCTIIRPRIRNCGLAGIAIAGGSGHLVLTPIIEGTNLYSTPILSQGNFQAGIYVLDHATHGVATNMVFVAPDISGTAHGVLVESYSLLDYSDRLLQFIAPNIHDVTGQHAFYLQSGGVSITGPVMRRIELAGVKVQSSADNNLNIRNITVTDAIGVDVLSNFFELADLGAGSISNVRLSGVGDTIGTGIAIVGNINDLKADLTLAAMSAHAATIQGDGPDDIDLTILARDMVQHGIVVSATNANNIRLRPTLRNPNTGNTAGQNGIIVASASATVDVFDPDITDSSTRMRYAVANTVAGGVLRLHGKVRMTGFLTGLLDNSGAPITGNFWQPYTPTMASSVGALTTASATGEWRQDNDIVYYKAIGTVTNNGTGSGLLRVGIPKAAAEDYVVNGRETALTGNSINGEIANGAVFASLAKYDGTYPAANGSVVRIEGFYKAAA